MKISIYRLKLIKCLGTRFKQKEHLKYDLIDGLNFKSFYTYAIEKLTYFFRGVITSIFVPRGGVEIDRYQKEFSDTGCDHTLDQFE
ncbi:MAG: hypothetical protein EZS28_049569, partial [Streblomastix strix]